MKYAFKVLLVVVAAAVFGVLPEMVKPKDTAAASIIYTVCRKFQAPRNCYNCSTYFSVRSRDEALAKCSRWGGDDGPYYFPSVGALHSWKVGNCTCRGDADEADTPR